MSSKKTSKWSTSSSISKLLSRISRTLSFSSKKSQAASKMVKPTEFVIKNVKFVPQSAPVIRRNPPQPIIKVLYDENSIEEDDNDYSFRPNLSLFSISVENLNSQQYDWLDEIFHSTKIEDY